MTASVVKKNYERITAPGRNTQVPFGAGPITFEADDVAGTFTMTLGTPFSEAIYAFGNNGIVCPASLTDGNTLITGTVGSGPYTIQSAVHADRVVFKRRDEWMWGPNGITAKDLPDTVTYKIVDSDTTAANLLLTGGLNIAQVGGSDVTRLLAEKSLISKTSTSYHNNTILFNQNPARPTADIKVREALASAFDREEYAKAAYQGRYVMSSSYIQPNADCFDPSTASLLPQSPSPDKARQILLADGFTAGPDGKLQKDGKPLTIQMRATPVVHGAGGEFLQAQWEKAGITVDAQITDFNTFVQGLAKHDFDAFLITWPADVPSPNVSIASYLGPTSSGEVKDTEAETALANARKAEGDERCKQWGLVQRAMLQNWDLLPTAAPTSYFFSRGIDFTPAGFNYSVLFLHKAT
jgi:peptide/nickel transport system substrate-binding protein